MKQHQYSLSLIQHEVSNSIVEQRATDGYINASALYEAAGKRWGDYAQRDKALQFQKVVEAKTGIPVLSLPIFTPHRGGCETCVLDPPPGTFCLPCWGTLQAIISNTSHHHRTSIQFFLVWMLLLWRLQFVH